MYSKITTEQHSFKVEGLQRHFTFNTVLPISLAVLQRGQTRLASRAGPT
jgi:hypothetical protein